MGKYEKWLPKMVKDNFNEEEFKFNALFAIANELAEANRLKRMELEFQYLSGYGSNRYEFDKIDLDKLLEDKV